MTSLLIAIAVLAGVAVPQDITVPRGYSIPLIDLDGDAHRQVVVDREAGQYLGHPTTVLLEDQETMLCVYPKGHGRGGSDSVVRTARGAPVAPNAALVQKISNDWLLHW